MQHSKKKIRVFWNSKPRDFYRILEMTEQLQMTRENKRVQIVTLRQEGFSLREIATKASVDRRTVQRVCKRVQKTSSFKDQPRSGRPPLLDDRQKRLIARSVNREETKTAETIRKEVATFHNINVSRDTIARALKSFGYVARVKIKKPALSEKQRKARLAWAREYVSWTVDDWKNVVWSDESKFTLVNSEGKEYVWVREKGQNLDLVTETKKFGGGKVMVWGCMTWEGVGYARKIDSIMDAKLYSTILKKEMIDSINHYKLDRSKVIFQQDNDPKHTSHLARDTLKKLKMKILPWPAQSPDLSPIEHLWDHVQRQLRKESRIFATKDALWARIEDELELENTELCRKLIGTMSERIIDVIRAKGGHTRW